MPLVNIRRDFETTQGLCDHVCAAFAVKCRSRSKDAVVGVAEVLLDVSVTLRSDLVTATKKKSDMVDRPAPTFAANEINPKLA